MSALILALALSGHALAASSYCIPAAQVHAAVDYCYQNSFFVAAADQCLEKLDQDVISHRDRLTTAFGGHDAKSVSAQQSKFGNTGADLTDTDVSLRDLVTTALKARSELVTYTRTLIYVNDSSPGFLAAYGLVGDHQQDPCFHENYSQLADRIGKLDRKIAELRRADAGALALNASTGARQAHLDADPSSAAGRAAASTRGAGAAQVRAAAGTSRNPASTITGEIRKNKLP